MIATRAPLRTPFACSQAPKSRDRRSSSAKSIVLPMLVNAGRSRYSRMLFSKSSTSERNCWISISAGTPGGELFSQMRSIALLLAWRVRADSSHDWRGEASRAYGGIGRDPRGGGAGAAGEVERGAEHDGSGEPACEAGERIESHRRAAQFRRRARHEA